LSDDTCRNVVKPDYQNTAALSKNGNKISRQP